ncbi:MAG: redoxin domain-containing protein [Clostridia bacterium]|nr:redoxin domain-containing protein [Clostridia bacterium]
MLEAGMEALDFSLSVKEGNQVLLSGFHGMKVILYFCPKDNAPGCAGRRFLRI